MSSHGPSTPSSPGRQPRSGLPSGAAPLLLAAAAIALALIAVPLGRALSPLDRSTTLDLARTGLRDTYLMSSKTSPGRCYLVNRREATVRRSDPDVQGWMRWCDRFDDQGPRPASWLLRSKRKGTVFLVPVEQVPDWSYPFLYAQVDALHPDLDLGAVEWTQLFLDRVYQGLYLRVDLPRDPRRKDGRTGELREILAVRGPALVCANTRFETPCTVYPSCVGSGIFPELVDPPPDLAWLAAHRPVDGTTLLLAGDPPFEVSLLPLPLSLEELLTAFHGSPPRSALDERIQRWGRTTASRAGASPFDDARLATLRHEFEVHAGDLVRALTSHGELHGNRADLFERLPLRQASVVALGLEPGAGPG
jgi:hypothetical protein